MADTSELLMLQCGAESPDFIRVIKRFRPGSVLLRGLKGLSTAELAGRLAEVEQASNATPFLAIEDETRAADILANWLPALPAPRLAAENGRNAVERLGGLIGQGCALVGFNTYFPLALDSSGSQSFHADPQRTAEFASAFVRGLKRGGVLAGGRNFPAPGAIVRSEKLPILSKALAELWREDLAAYRELGNELSMVQIGVVACKAYDFEILRPATVSTGVIGGLLRAKLGYDGIAVANAARTAEALGEGTEEAAVESLAAGCDLVVVEGDEDAVRTVARAVEEAAASGTLPAARIEEARRRLRRAKRGLSRPPAGKLSRSKLDRLERLFRQFSETCAA